MLAPGHNGVFTMLQLLAGLILFIGVHSISIVALPFRDRMAASNRIGWMAVYGIVSVIGIVLIARGYADARLSPTVLYSPPAALRHVAALLMLPVFVFFVAPYFPGKIKAALKHPQLVAVKLWAFAHLLTNGTLADVVLFGSLLTWAVVDRISLKRRPARPLPGAGESALNDAYAIVIGLAAYGGFVFWAHGALIGVHPFG